MDARFLEAFDGLYRGVHPILDPELAASPLVERVQAAVNDADAALSERGLFMRPDAKLALLMNALAMVVLPIQIGNLGRIDPGLTESPSELFDRLGSDIQVVAEGASTGLIRESEVSSRAIYTSISQNWPELQLAWPQLWD